jgi:hypothetical protein
MEIIEYIRPTGTAEEQRRYCQEYLDTVNRLRERYRAEAIETGDRTQAISFIRAHLSGVRCAAGRLRELRCENG